MSTKEQAIETVDNQVAPPALPSNGGPKPGASDNHLSEIVGEAPRILVRTPWTDAGPAFRMYCVITSYSIHYTKLYDNCFYSLLFCAHVPITSIVSG